jgi:hypothetical protein
MTESAEWPVRAVRADVAEADVVALEVGAVYWFLGVGAGPGVPCDPDKGPRKGREEAPYWLYPPHPYRLVGLATPVRFLNSSAGRREEVVVEGLEGPERGRLYTMALEDFARHYRRQA